MSARPFTESEYLTLVSYLAQQGRLRDKLLIQFGCGSGFRINELTSLTYGQVWDDVASDLVREVTIARRNLKGGRGVWKKSVRGRRIPLSEEIRVAIREYLMSRTGWLPDSALFATARSGHNRPMHRGQAWRLIIQAAADCGFDTARISTHSLRKTFIGRVYLATGRDLVATQRIVGHTSPLTTARYLESDAAELDRVVLSLGAPTHVTNSPQTLLSA